MAKAQPKARKPGVLDALKAVPKAKAGSQSLNKALSSIKGVKAPGAGGYKTSSLMGKVKGVQIGGAAGGVSTSSLNSLLRKGSGPAALKRVKAGKVRGRVRPRARKSKIKGALSREQIMKVISKLVPAIQYCYEKELRTNPSLTGKVVLEWTIKPSGRVGVVKTGRSTLKSPKAINCMTRKLKGARFPKPNPAGKVIVTFPFVFNTL